MNSPDENILVIRRTLFDELGAFQGLSFQPEKYLAAMLAHDPRTRVLIAHGASDLVTPYFENQMIVDQFPPFASPDRLKLSVYGGGHMFYSRDASRRALRDDARAMFARALQRE